MSTSQAISANAEHHSSLLASISELDYVPSALKQQISYINSLSTDITRLENKVVGLQKRTKKERKEHEHLRDSVAKKFLFRVAGKKDKFAEMASKEEREYVEALEIEMRERKQKEMMEQMLYEGIEVRNELEEKNKHHTALLAELEALYSKIFDGTTSEFPRDDELEDCVSSALAIHENIQSQLNAESQALNLLRRADDAMTRSVANIHQSLMASQWDMYGGSTMADMMERDYLAGAGANAAQATTLVQQARNWSPHVQVLESAPPPKISLLGDVFFDNIYSDLMAHRKIEAYAGKLAQLQTAVKSQVSLSIQRTNMIGSELNQASSQLEQARKQLNDFRRETFLSVGKLGAPPLYLSPPPSATAPGHQGDDDAGGLGMRQYEPPAGLSQNQTTTDDGQPPPTPPKDGHQQSYYAPPPGPPPGHPESSPSPAQESTSTSSTYNTETPLFRMTVPLASPPSFVPGSSSLVAGGGGTAPGAAGGVPSSPSKWGSRNPYAAMLAKAETEVGGSGSGSAGGGGGAKIF